MSHETANKTKSCCNDNTESCCNDQTESCCNENMGSCCAMENKKTCCASDENVQYFKSSNDVKTGMNVRITSNATLLGKCWDESGLGPMDELESLCNVVGCIQEIEESDNTIELRWENYDTAWIPIKACSDAGDSKPTLPGVSTSWLSPNNEENKNSDDDEEEQQEVQEEQDESAIKYLESVEDLQIGTTVCVTKDLDLLDKYWQTANLAPNDSKYNYLGVEGIVESKNEDYDTIQVRYSSSESATLPVQACYRASGVKSAF